ncbi:DUF305 domain-containing protein [Mycobacterium sp.]|uniref:DUF305 domain-containing protein n=1 Tax=Mycobacterium sp. TaxID=1785 RepID=UPI001205E014|nr:DUF305 domain-containing protein [Mycobacterium sp.]TAM63437.1 MAG: DUF305 domain-containing protein [Mycobacterium sp.]
MVRGSSRHALTSAAKRAHQILYAGTVPPLTTRFAAAVAACATVALLSSCSHSPSGNHASPLHSDDKPVITGEPAAYNATDVSFANNMITLEEQGITISRQVPDHSTDSGITTFAARTVTALQVDMQVLKALRAQWKEGQDNQPAAGGPGLTASGTIDNNTLARLDSLQGPGFDTLWLNSMIGLNQGAIQLANAEVASGKNVDAVNLATQIAKARQSEITQMQDILSS